MIIAQISDPHITQDPARAEPAAACLRAAVSHLMRLAPRPDLVVVTGDCTDHGSADEYARFRDLISPLTMPVYVIPGNHDNRSALLDAFGAQGAQPLEGFAQYVVDGPVRLIALDSHIPGQGGGELCERRLAWLEARLAEAPDGRP